MSKNQQDIFEFSFYCPHCNQNFSAQVEDIGRKAECPKCKNQIVIEPHGECFEGLNYKQKMATVVDDGIIRVAAGAGTGKTRVLVHRLAHLINDLGIPPDEILSVTFTNKAAGVMKRRARLFLGDNVASRISTFHGFCNNMLKEDIHCVNFPPTFRILDTEDQKQILSEIYDERGISGKEKTYKKALDDISFLKHRTNYVPYLTKANFDISSKFLPSGDIRSVIFNEYLIKQRRDYSLDFDDLILFAVHILQNFEEIKSKWNDRIRYIQVDEFQDVNETQMMLLNLLLGDNKNLFVVGDPDQNIYSFRGARIDFFLNLDNLAQQLDRKFVEIILDDNYRSFQSILDISNQMISHNKERIEKELHAIKGQGDKKPLFFHAKNNIAESEWVGQQIAALNSDGRFPFHDIAILLRGIHLTRALENTFIKQKIPYDIINGLRFYERKEIKDALAYLRLVSDEDDLSFLRIINNPPRGIGKTRLNYLKKYANENNISIWEAFKQNAGTGLFSDSTMSSVLRKATEKSNQQCSYKPLLPTEFVGMVESIKSMMAESNLSDIVDAILTKSRYDAYLLESGDEERKNNLLEFKSGIIEAEKEAEERLNIHDYLNEIAIYSEQQENNDKDTVKMMTIHTSKGQEFPFVFVPFFNEHIIPTCHAVKPKEIEEERRVAYVAFTRAEKQLFISNSDGNEMDHYLLPSRFLLEIKQDCLAVDGVIPADYWDESKAKIESMLERQKAGPSLNVGNFIEHGRFGMGKIIEIKEGCATILFKNGEKRNLVLNSLTKLEKEDSEDADSEKTKIYPIKSDASENDA